MAFLLRGIVTCGLALLSAGLAAIPAVAAAAPLTEAEERGRQIYFSGESPSGEDITAYLSMGGEQLELPGEAATCGSCHGHDGTGRPESGVLPSNITWSHLTRAYGHVHAGDLEHPAFDEESLRVYMRTGVYPGGRRGDPSMPFYAISDADLDDLVAYLRLVGTLTDPGLTATSIRIGTVIPADGPLAPAGGAIRQVLEAYFAEANRTGGIYGRRLELAVHAVPEEDATVPEAMDAWLAEAQPFALLSPFTPRMDFEAQSAIAGRGIPVIGPFTLYAIGNFTLNRNIFYLYPGLGEQLEALLVDANRRFAPSRPDAAVLYPGDSPLAEVRGSLGKAARKLEWPALREESFRAGQLDWAAAVRRLRKDGIDVVVFLGVETELRALLDAAAQAGWHPDVLVPGPLAGTMLFDAPAAFAGRLNLAYPTLPQDRQDWGLREIFRLLAASDLPRAHVQAAISAHAAAKVLVEGLRRAGRELGRRELVGQLEKLYEFETGLTPPITYTANRRVGARGAYVVSPDSLVEGRLPAQVEWVEVD